MSTPNITLPAKIARVRARLATWQSKLAEALGLSARTLRAVCWTLGVLAVIVIGLKLSRVSHYRYETPPALWKRAALLCSELEAMAGLTCGALAIAMLGQRARTPRLALSVIQLMAVTSFLASCLVHGYFVQTGNTLDYSLFAFAWARPRETGPIVASAIGTGLGVLLLLGPIVLLFPGMWSMLRRTTPAPEARPHPALTRMLACACLSVWLLWRASSVHVAEVEPGFAREALVQLVTGYWSAHRTRSAPRPDTHVPARRSGATTLVRTSASAAPLNVAIIVLESARADATTPYVPALETTPFLARIAAQGTLVEHAYTVVPHTSKALVAMLCGFEPRTTSELVETEPAGLPGKCLPQLLRENGYDTVFFQAPRKAFESYPRLISNLGFARFVAGDDMPQRGFELINYFGYEDAIMLGPNRKWLAEQAHEPFLAVYLTSASHHPYRAPKHWAQHVFSRQGDKNAYLNALSYVDSIAAEIVAQYEAAGLFERTLFVLLGDHGEGFDEHGMSTHDDILYEEGVRVPLVLRAPASQHRPARIAGPVSQLALVPSILDVIGFAADGGSYEAESIYRQGSQEPVQIACFRNAHCLASVRERHKLIYYYTDRPTQLFDLAQDPAERHNLASEQPERVSAWVNDLLNWETAVDKLHQTSSQTALQKYVQRTTPVDLPHACNVRFGDQVELIGFKNESKPRGDGVILTYHVHVLRRLPPGYHFVMHLRSDFWHTRALDEQPARGLYPYWRWQPGDYITSVYRTDWPADWRVMETCLELLDAEHHTIAAHTIDGKTLDCAPLSTLDHQTLKERAPNSTKR